MSETLEDIVGRLQESWTVNDRAVDAYEADRERRHRRENLEAVGGVITDADIERIIWDRVDTFAGKVVRRFLAAAAAPDGPRYCWLAGGLGRGKTVAACLAIAMERGRYMTAEQVRRAFAQETQEARDLRSFATHCRLLVVDDIGTERGAAETHAMDQALYQLLNARQGKGRLTILTGNQSLEEIHRAFNARTIARIEHQGKIVVCRGENLRRRR